MGKKKQSLFEDLIEIAAHFPWWVSVLLAVIAYLFLHNVATTEVATTAQPGQIGDMVGRQMYKTFASIGQFLLPLIFLIGAIVSFARGAKKPKLKLAKVRGSSAKRSKNKLHTNNVTELSSWRQEPVLHDDAHVRHQVLQDRLDELHHDSWSVGLIKSLEWKRFEELCAGLFLAKGYDARITELGADGGIDIHLYKAGSKNPLGIVQCKAWNSRGVGVKPIRELYGVMAAEKIPLGIFIASGDFTDDARAFAKGKHVKLLTGTDLIELIEELPEEKKTSLLTETTKGDYTTPTCPSCGIKMKLRTAKKGGKVGSKFWGCVNYPRCKQNISIAKGG